MIPHPENKETPKTNKRGKDIVHEASEDSFPASDPPAWTKHRGPGSPTTEDEEAPDGRHTH